MPFLRRVGDTDAPQQTSACHRGPGLRLQLAARTDSGPRSWHCTAHRLEFQHRLLSRSQFDTVGERQIVIEANDLIEERSVRFS